MNWVIIALVVLSIIGSVMWVMPSPRQRMQAAMRQKAMTSGLKIQMVKLKCPRAIGEAEAEERSIMAYRLPRTDLSREEKANHIAWQVFRLNAMANDGLIEGWCWGKGERQLSADKLSRLNEILSNLPATAFALESTEIATGLYWEESGGVDAVDRVKSILSQLIEAKL